MIQRYPKNPRYLEFRGQPILSIGSAEHYGAVLNSDFDFDPYLNNMASHGLNQCRVFSGTYRELPGEFGIEDNLLAPRPEAFCCPWELNQDGFYDLDIWSARYWDRLKEFVTKASEKKILVEYVLFCHWYNDNLWLASPMHPRNSVQRVGPTDRKNVYALENDGLWLYVEKFIRKAAQELEEFDNVYFEIVNEPYSNQDHGWYDRFHFRVAEVLAEAAPTKLVALNFANRTGVLPELPKNIGIVNFHYAIPEAVHLNRHLNLVLADDETGFAGQTAEPYRKEAWRFLMSGGAMFSHLDYGYTVKTPDGSYTVEGTKTPGYGGADLRAQLGFLRRFLEEIEAWNLVSLNEALTWNAGTVSVPILGDPGRFLAAYFSESPAGTKLGFGIPPGEYTLRWIDPIACKEIATEVQTHPGGYFFVMTPAPESVLTLTLTRTQP
jgi:hypothetical protein